MKQIVVYFDAPGFEGYPFTDKDFRLAYHQLGELIQEKGGQFWIARGQDSYIGKQSFTGGWKYADGTFHRVDSRIDLDVIFNKGNIVADDEANIVNGKDLEELCTNKAETYRIFPLLCPKTIKVHSPDELAAAVQQMKTVHIVVKPLDKEGGDGVFIGPAAEAMKNVQLFPYLVQEFIDTSGGIPGIVEGHHDLRIANVNGDITHCYYRTPPKGSLLANVSLGGKFSYLEYDQIPAAAMAVFRKIENYMERFERRIYSVDIGLDADNTWKIIELNSKPGLLPQGEHPGMRKFHEKVADLLLS